MGLIKATAGSVGGVLADQWKEYFYCDALNENVLMKKGIKRTSARSSNTKASDNIISKGSVIAVADGQCMLIVEQGKIVEVAAEPGEFIFDSSTEPTIFAGNLGTSIVDVFKTIGKRFTFGGEPPKDQRIYYINTKELIGNKYGTPSAVPFRVVDERAAIDIDISIRCFGEYSYKISNPLLFYTNVCGNADDEFTRERIESQMKTELLTALQPAFAKISEMGIRYSALPGHTTEMAQVMNEELSEKWHDLRGIEIVSFGVSSVKADEEDEKMIKEMQRNTAFMDTNRAAAHLVGAQAEAMQSAAKNESAGSAMAFMGMNMANTAGGANASNLYSMNQNNIPVQKTSTDIWICSCGAKASGKFCPECGAARPQKSSWKCPKCGKENEGKFCMECGSAKPNELNGWTCQSCGKVNKGKFCSECGAKKPSGVPQYKCDKCGWELKDPAHPPKFCPECGDPFDDGDIK